MKTLYIISIITALLALTALACWANAKRKARKHRMTKAQWEARDKAERERLKKDIMPQIGIRPDAPLNWR